MHDNQKPLTRPRIAYVINSLEGGGAALPVPAIAEVLRGVGADVRVFALLKQDGRALPAMTAAGLDPAVREGSKTDHLKAALWLRRELRNWGATHMWTSLSRATILGLMVGPGLGLPVVCWQHNAFLKPWNLRLMRALRSRAALWVADSRSVAELTAARLQISNGKLASWPIYFADPQMPQSQPWQPGQTLRLGSLGRLHPAKGYDVLLTALAQLSAHGFNPPAPFEIEVAGDGALLESLRATARDMGLDCIRFTGFTEHPRDFLKNLHLYLQPSRAEGFCIAAHEALTAGLPVIGSRVGEMPHSIRPEGTGWLIRPDDVESLVGSLRDALSEPGNLAQMGAAARTDMLDRFSHARFEAAGRAIWDRVQMSSH